MIPSSIFREQLATAATYIASRRNPNDGGWGLNIESDYQASSIVNTAEALFVLRRGCYTLEKPHITIDFLESAGAKHPSLRGDYLRFHTFVAWGLTEAGVPGTDPVVARAIECIGERASVDGLGWRERNDEPRVRILPTFLSLYILAMVRGADFVVNNYSKCLEHLIEVGKRNDFCWGFDIDSGKSLAGTSYVSLLLSICFPAAPEAAKAYRSVQAQLAKALEDHAALEVESIPGTDWHHYSYCWALKALIANPALFDRHTYHFVSQTLQHISSLFITGKGYREPGKQICNVRSIFNNVLAVSAVIEGFDPSWMVATDRVISAAVTTVEEEELFESDAGTRSTVSETVTEREQSYHLAVAGRASNIERVRVLRPLTGGYSGAAVDLCEIWHKGGTPGLYQVLKLATLEDVDQEAKGAQIAAEVVPSQYRVSLLDSQAVGDGKRGVLRFEYASSRLIPGDIVPFLEFLEQTAEADQVGQSVAALFNEGLRNGLSGVQPTAMTLREIREKFEELRKGTFWSSIIDGIRALEESMAILSDIQCRGRMLLRFPYHTVLHCLCETARLEKAWDALFTGGYASLAHRDLNPRNILMVRSDTGFRPVLIDFHRFGGPTPLPLDFCRLEAGVNIKGLRTVIETVRSDPQIEDDLVTYCTKINSVLALDIGDAKLRGMPPPLHRAAIVVGSIRRSYLGFAPHQAQEDCRLYFGTLALCYLSYVRPIYQQVLTLRQRLHSLYCGASILEWHFLR